ncbi:unnamed protein product [Symbiodinium sp. CCMP2592]|nr:unnamed protein product [Symbiodinium sp. CCMP2592]
MDLEGVSKDDLMQAAAELQHLQTMALRGEDFASAYQPPPRAQPTRSPARLPPATEVFTFTGETEEQPQQKYDRPIGKGLDQGKGQLPTTRGTGRRPLFAPAQSSQAAPQRGQRRPHQAVSQSTQPSGSPLLTNSSANLVASVARLLLRHEDQLTGLAQNTTWIMFQGTVPPLTPVPAQMRIGEQWQLTKTESPAALKHPLRTVLFQTWLSELKVRVEELGTDQVKYQEAVRLGALSEPNTFHYKKWSPTLRALESVTDRAPLTADEVLGLINEAMVLSTLEDALINYHPTKQLLPEMTGPTVTFSLVVGLKDPKSYRLWTVIETLSGSGALMLVATTLRRERRARSQLAQAVAQDLRRLPLDSTVLKWLWLITLTTATPMPPCLPTFGPPISTSQQRHWPHSGRQQDAADFLSHVQQALGEESEVECEDAPLLRQTPYTVDDLQRFSVPGQWPKSPASTAEADTDSQARGTTIILNVYHLTQSEGVQWFNTLFAHEHAPVQLLGLFHVGVQVGDEEWAFGATLGGSGVCRHKPRGADQHHFHRSIVMGSTALSKRKLDVMYRTLEDRWSGASYCPLQNNCIDFASEVCRLLDVADIPAWVNRPARLGSFLGRLGSSLGQARLPEPPVRSLYL